MFVFVAIMDAGLPGPGDATLIAAGALAGDGKLNIWIVLAVAMVAWMLGSVIGLSIGAPGDVRCRPPGETGGIAAETARQRRPRLRPL